MEYQHREGTTMLLVKHMIKRYGWGANIPDQRDHSYIAPLARNNMLPPLIDLRRQSTSVIYDQGKLGSCRPAL